MKKQADRRAIVTSAALTLLILLGIGGVVLLSGNPLAAAAGDKPASVVPSPDGRRAVMPLTAAPAAVSMDDPVVAAYQAQLQEAYQALNEAYTQIDALQAAQAPASAQSHDDHEDRDDAWDHDDKSKSSSKEHDDHEHDDHDRDDHARDDD